MNAKASKTLIGRCPGCDLVTAASYRPDAATARGWIGDGLVVTLVDSSADTPAFARGDWVEVDHDMGACVAAKHEAMLSQLEVHP